MAQSALIRSCQAGQFTLPHYVWAGLVLLVVNQYLCICFGSNFLNQTYSELTSRQPFIGSVWKSLPLYGQIQPMTNRHFSLSLFFFPRK